MGAKIAQTDGINPRILAFRALAFALAVLPLSLLLLARQLEPSSAGLGTHQQLGLPPCTMRVMFGIRCPSCGMTTSWSYFSRGGFTQSAESNAGGFLLAIYSVAFAAFSFWAAVTGRMPGYAAQQWFAVSLLSIVGVTLVDWGVRIFG